MAHKQRGRKSRALRLKVVHVEYPADVQRPRTRGECAGGPRPCPFAGCRHHLYLEVIQPKLTMRSNGRPYQRKPGVVLNFPDVEVWELKNSCALDVADEYALLRDIRLEDVAEVLGISREAVRQIEEKALARSKQADPADVARLEKMAAEAAE